mgnify:FL=1
MEIPINLVNDIINYLARQPYKDVAGLIGSVMRLQQQEQSETEEKELPLV